MQSSAKNNPNQIKKTVIQKSALFFLYVFSACLSLTWTTNLEAGGAVDQETAFLICEKIEEWDSLMKERPLPEDKLNLLGIQIHGSVDLGGHGGTFQASVDLKDKTHYVFLKPKDATESRNYKIIRLLDVNLADFMPEIYGEVQIMNQGYLVMENTRMSPNGASLEQLVDIKLAGKIDGESFNGITGSGFNPIANQEEMLATRKETKPFLDYLQMGIGSNNSPNFMIAVGAKALRILNYPNSEEILKNSLKKVPKTDLEFLCQELNTLTTILKESPVAFIGASIILVAQEDGSIKPILLDPAHMQVDNKIKEFIDAHFDQEESALIYYGQTSSFNKQKMSNENAMFYIMLTIGSLL